MFQNNRNDFLLWFIWLLMVKLILKLMMKLMVLLLFYQFFTNPNSMYIIFHFTFLFGSFYSLIEPPSWLSWKALNRAKQCKTKPKRSKPKRSKSKSKSKSKAICIMIMIGSFKLNLKVTMIYYLKHKKSR